MTSARALSPFVYPITAHTRKHGPSGYEDYTSYKPWLRDEFTFRCVFCLVRERWYPNGSDAFGVDHLVPKASRPDLECSYDNLVYCCNRCNSQKNVKIVVDPCKESLGNHLKIACDGTIEALTKEGLLLIRAFRLDHRKAITLRRQKIAAIERWEAKGDDVSIEELLSYPDSEDFPNLSNCRCENSKATGIRNSYYEINKRDELEPTY